MHNMYINVVIFNFASRSGIVPEEEEKNESRASSKRIRTRNPIY